MKKNRKSYHSADTQSIDGGLLLGIIIGTCVFVWSGSFMLSFLPVIIIPFLAKLGELEENTRISRKYTQTEEERIQAIKRKERVQQQLKVTIISPHKQIKEKNQSQPTNDNARKLLPLLEVDKFQ